MNAKEFLEELYKGVPPDKVTYLYVKPDGCTYPYTIGQMDQKTASGVSVDSLQTGFQQARRSTASM